MFDSESDEDSVPDSPAGAGERRCGEVRAAAVGGGRGVFAAAALEAGTLVAAEVPTLVWPECDFSDAEQLLVVLRSVLLSPPASAVTTRLHPRSLDDVSAEERGNMTAMLSEEALHALASEAQCSTEESLRVALALQHNGFSSGLYEALCLFNHSCDPCCLKLAPKNAFSPSEVWTTRPVAEGEELTICYCTPMETTSTHMRAYLRENHHFDCACSRCVSEGDKPSSAVDEGALEQLEHFEREMVYQALDSDSEVARRSKRIYRQVLGGPASDDLLLRARAFRVGVTASLASIHAYESGARQVRLECASAFVLCCARLLQCQLGYLGPDHPEVGATLQDLLEGLRGISTRFPSETASTLALLRSMRLSSASDTNGWGVGDFLTWGKTEVARIRALFAAHRRYPGTLRIYNQPGRVFWGTC